MRILPLLSLLTAAVVAAFLWIVFIVALTPARDDYADIRQACRDRGGVPVDSNDRQGFVLAIRCDLP